MAEVSYRGLAQHVLNLLSDGGAHLNLDGIAGDLNVDEVNQKISGLPYTIWEVLEHMRIAGWDIVEFSRDDKHQSPDFPAGYWPDPGAKTNASELSSTLAEIRQHLTTMRELVSNPSADLTAPIPHGDGQTLLREALLLADHNAYHLGALAVMKRIVRGSEV